MTKVTDVVISHNSIISLHVQLHNQLRHLIVSGQWPNGTRIPSETQFAEHLNVSRTTIRLALQQAEIEGLIERVAGRGTFVAYHPSNERQSRLVAFVTCGFDAQSHLLMLTGADNRLKSHGYQISLNHARNFQEEMEAIKRMRREDIAGILLWPNTHAAQSGQRDVYELYQQIQLPMVLMDRQIYGVEHDLVTSDNYVGAQALMRHLVELGHEHVVFLSHHEMKLMPVAERYRAYRDVLIENGFDPVEPWLIGRPGDEIGASDALRASVDPKSPELRQIQSYMQNAQPTPTAIFAMNDYIAILAMRTMRLLNLNVPDAVSIAGFDDIDMAVHLEVPLTTVAQDPFMIGSCAAQLLLERLEGDAEPVRHDIIPTQLRIRSSTSVAVRV